MTLAALKAHLKQYLPLMLTRSLSLSLIHTHQVVHPHTHTHPHKYTQTRTRTFPRHEQRERLSLSSEEVFPARSQLIKISLLRIVRRAFDSRSSILTQKMDRIRAPATKKNHEKAVFLESLFLQVFFQFQKDVRE